MLTNRSIPNATVIPVLTYSDVDQAVASLTAAFGFTLRLMVPGHRAQLNIGDGAMVVRQAILPPTDPALTPDHYIMVRIDDANVHHHHASQHGAQILQPPPTSHTANANTSPSTSPDTAGPSPNP